MDSDQSIQEELQRQEFRNILFALAESQERLKDKAERFNIYKRLEKLYAPANGETFRHFYSDIFSVLTTIKQGDKPGSIDILGQNLAEIRKGYRAKNTRQDGTLIDISDNIRKLYDHVSLDIARIGYSDAADRVVSQESSIKDIQSQIALLNEQRSALSSQVAEKLDEVKGIQKEYIAILGIFASVVLAFTGSIAFSTSIFQNLHLSNIYRIVLVSLILGAVLVNALYGLFYYIDRLVNRYEEKSVKPLWAANIFFLVLIAATILCWTKGVVEQRNLNLEPPATSSVIEETNNQTSETVDK